MYRNRQHLKKSKQTGYCFQGLGRGARLGNAPRIGDDRI
jgi:hypothetical protein